MFTKLNLLILSCFCLCFCQLNGAITGQRERSDHGTWPNGYSSIKHCSINYDYTKKISIIYDEIDTCVWPNQSNYRVLKIDTIISPLGPLFGGVRMPQVPISTLYNDTLLAWFSSPSYLSCVDGDVPYDNTLKIAQAYVSFMYNGISYDLHIFSFNGTITFDNNGNVIATTNGGWGYDIHLTGISPYKMLYNFKYTLGSLRNVTGDYPDFSSIKIAPYKIVNNKIESKSIMYNILGQKITNRITLKNNVIEKCYYIYKR
jgi:hypothetical protein